jgi:hypothetical protein
LNNDFSNVGTHIPLYYQYGPKRVINPPIIDEPITETQQKQTSARTIIRNVSNTQNRRGS